MIFWFLVGLLLMVVGMGLVRWYANAPTGQAKSAFKIIAGVAVGLVAFLLLTRTGVTPILSGAAALAPVLLGLRGALRRARAAQGPSPGGESGVHSAWFDMSLDHDSGAISGRVLQGDYAERDLDDLTERELDEIAAACTEDVNSSRLLAAYMARRFGRPEPDAEEAADAPSSSGAMSREEALAVLGVEPGADADEINAAYKRLIQVAHPDRGGSAYLAARINQARAALLGER